MIYAQTLGIKKNRKSRENTKIAKMMEKYYDQANEYTQNVDLETFKNSNWFDDMKSKIDMEEVINAGVKTAQLL